MVGKIVCKKVENQTLSAYDTREKNSGKLMQAVKSDEGGRNVNQKNIMKSLALLMREEGLIDLEEQLKLTLLIERGEF